MRITALIVALALISGAEGQRDAPLSTRTLQPGSSQSLEVPPFSFFGAAQSDKEGNLYFHVSAGSFRRPVVLKLHHSSGDPTLYSLEDDDQKKTVFEDFSVTPSGQVLILCQQTDQNSYVLRFSSQGTLQEKIILDMPESTSTESFAAFDSGAFLISAYYIADAPAQLRGKSFVALFDGSGKMRKKFNSDDGVDLKSVSQHISEGGATVGPDGNIYVLQPGQVLVISESGKILRRIKFQKPDSSFATKIAVSQNLLSIWLLKEGPKQKMAKQAASAEYLVLDLITGKPFGFYVPAKELGEAAIAVAFSSQEGFTFFDTQDGHVELISAPLH